MLSRLSSLQALWARCRRLLRRLTFRPRRTPSLLQMEAVECGAAALAMILGYHGRHVPLDELRDECGVTRDGTKASNLIKTAQRYQLDAKGLRIENPERLKSLPLPMIVFWNFNHFLVVEGFSDDQVYLNDPANGHRTVSWKEFDEAFTGVALILEPGPDFAPGGRRASIRATVLPHLSRSRDGVLMVLAASLALLLLDIALPGLSLIFVDYYLIGGVEDWLPWILATLVGIGVLQAAFTWLYERHLLLTRVKLAVQLSTAFMEHAFRLPYRFFQQRNAGEIGSRVDLNDEVAGLIAGDLAGLALSIVSVLFFALILLQFDVVLASIGIATGLANILVFRLLSGGLRDAYLRLSVESGKLNGTTLSGFQMLESIKASGSESHYFSRWAGQHVQVINTGRQLAMRQLLMDAAPTLLGAFTVAAVLCVGGLRVMDGAITIGIMVAVQALIGRLLSPIDDLLQFGAQIHEVRGDLSRLDDVVRCELAPEFAQAADTAATELSKLSGRVALCDLGYAYNRFDPPVLQGIELTLEPGTSVALVGSTGSGKSTLIRLLAALDQPTLGSIRFDGRALPDIPREVLRNSLAVIEQQPRLFAGTLHDNITMWDDTLHDESVARAIEDAQLNDLVASLVGGTLALIEEGGRNLSGGQRQRVEIARALVAEPSILIVDEGTSALDPLTEEKVMLALRRRGCTCIFVAHRLSTIRDCDEILVLDRGHIAERGSHDELASQDGLYRRLLEN